MKQLTLRRRLVVIFCLSIVFFSHLSGAQLKPVKTIGNDDNESYMFMKVGGGVISSDKSIFVCDIKGHFIAKYSWDGKFIKRIGQKGRGPGSFYSPMHLDLFDGRLYFLDFFNFRTVETDLGLNSIKYHKLPSTDIYLDCFLFIDRLQYIGAYLSGQGDGGYHFIKHTNLEPLSENTFWTKTAVPIDNKKFHTGKLSFFLPVLGLDRANNQLIIGYSYPDKKMQFFVSSMDGKCIDSFSFILEKDYSFPDFIRDGKRAPNDFTWLRVYKIFVHKNVYIVHVGKVRIKNRLPVKDEMKKYFLIFDSKTKTLKEKLSIPATKRFFFLTEDGYLIGADSYEEIPKVHIYKLDL